MDRARGSSSDRGASSLSIQLQASQSQSKTAEGMGKYEDITAHDHSQTKEDRNAKIDQLTLNLEDVQHPESGASQGTKAMKHRRRRRTSSLPIQLETSQPQSETVEGMGNYEDVTANDHSQTKEDRNAQIDQLTSNLEDVQHPESGASQITKAGKHRRRRRYRKKDVSKSSQLNVEANCQFPQEEIGDDMEYVVQDDWTVKAVPKKDRAEGVRSEDVDEWGESSLLDERISSAQLEDLCASIPLPDEDDANDGDGDRWEVKDDCTDTSQNKRPPQISKIVGELNQLIISVKNDECDDQQQSTPVVVPTLGHDTPPKKPGFVLDESALNDFELNESEFNKSHYLQDNTLEVLIEKNPEKDYLHVTVYVCNGAKENPERISRNSFRICDSAVISSNSSKSAIKKALFETAKRLEKVSADSYISDEKQPYEVSECSLEYLAKRRIEPLKKKSTRFTRAVYYCNLCHFHINSVSHAITHIESKEHQQIEQRNAMLSKLSNLPTPCDAHLQSISDLLMRTLEETEVERRTYDDCEQLIDALERIFKIDVHQDCSLTLYGSYLVRGAHIGSDVNFSLKCPEKLTPGQIVQRVCESLASRSLERWRISDVTTDLKCEFPTILFCLNAVQQNDECQLKSVKVAISATRYVKTWKLIAVYARIESFLKLSRLFQCWAQTCSLNVTALGGLPKKAFYLMLIHYLQTKQLLPFLDEMMPKKDETETNAIAVGSNVEEEIDEQQMVWEIEKWNREWDIPRLWVGLFRYFVLEHSTKRLVQIRFRDSGDDDERPKDMGHFNCKRIAIEDPFSPKRIMQPSQYFVEYFLNCFYTTFLYFWIPRTLEGPLISYRIYMLEASTTSTPKKTKKKSAINTKMSTKRVNNASIESSCQETTATETVFDNRQPNKDKFERGTSLDVDCTNCQDDSDMWNDTDTQLVNCRNEMQSKESFSCVEEKGSRFVNERIVIGRDGNASSTKCVVESVGNPVKELSKLNLQCCQRNAESESSNDSRKQIAGNSIFDPGSAQMHHILNGQIPETEKSVDMSTEKGVDVEVASKDLSADGATPDCDVQNRCYSRRMLMKLSENANHDFVPKERLEEIGLYCSWSLGSVTTENDVVSPAEEVSSPDNGLTESSAGTQETAINTVSTESSAGTQENTVNTESKKVQPSSKEAGEATEFGLLIADISEEMVQEIWHKLRKDDLLFEWCLQTLVGDLKPRIRCTSCGLSGHLIDACPELQLPKVVPIRPMDKKQKDLVDVLLRTVYRRLCMNADYERLLRDFRSQLEVCLMNGYRNDCRLSLFGSAGNGFGLIGSDADICLRFAAESISEEVDPCEVITDVAEVVKQMPGIAGVTPITNAKVPIVKVQCGRMFDRLEADISLYNVLALENTRLLRSYSELDERARILGIFVKEWAKRCEIGDASRGSLSSYSIIVMLIHFLQRCKPPVLPFLQEIDTPISPKKEMIVDGCDVYFCSAKNSEWHTENHQNLSDLWFGFLDYFSQRFDFASEVIQIRRREPISKLDKGWQGRPIAIEDPFELQHNLSSGVHLRTMIYIQRSFIRSRDHFGRIRLPLRPLNDYTIDMFLNNLFSACHVNSGPPLARNCCHRCKQIGHFVENCPLTQQKGHRRRSGTTTNNQPSTPSKEAYAMRQTHTAAVNRPKELIIRSAPASVDNQRPLLQTPNNNIFTTTGRGMSSVGGFGVRQRQRLNSNGQKCDRNGRGGRAGAPTAISTTPQRMAENGEHPFVIARMNDSGNGHGNQSAAVNVSPNTRGYHGGYRHVGGYHPHHRVERESM